MDSVRRLVGEIIYVQTHEEMLAICTKNPCRLRTNSPRFDFAYRPLHTPKCDNPMEVALFGHTHKLTLVCVAEEPASPSLQMCSTLGCNKILDETDFAECIICFRRSCSEECHVCDVF